MTAPLILYTNAPDGPTTGGENGNGGFLSLFGRNLYGVPGDVGVTTKVYIGGAEVAAYKHAGAAVTHPSLQIQRVDVQVGHAAGGAVGTPMAVLVTSSTGNSNTSITFTPSGGRVLFCDQAGNNSTFTPNDITRPARNLQLANNAGAQTWSIDPRAGDQVVIREGNWSEVGFDNAWWRHRYPESQGAAGKHIHFTSYPGEIVNYDTPTGTPPNTATTLYRGGFQGPDGGRAGSTGDYMCVSNMKLSAKGDSASDAAPVNAQSAQKSWLVTNVEGTWPSTISDGVNGGHAKGALFAGHPDGSRILGCYAHDFKCVGASENHCIAYIDGPDASAPNVSAEVAWNWGVNALGGNMVQFFDNLGNGNFDGCSVHDNFMDTGIKFGVNLDTNVHGFEIYNNVIANIQFAALRFAFYGGSLNVHFYNNSIYNCGKTNSSSTNGMITVDHTGTVTSGVGILVYCNIISAGPNTISSLAVFDNQGNSTPFMHFLGNLIFGAAQGWTSASLSGDSHLVVGDPKFVSASTLNLALQSTSPAINHATETVPALPYDITGLSRPQGAANDIGAFEFASTPTSPPTVVTPPTLGGTARAGASSVAVPGTYANGPVTLTYQWSTSVALGGTLTPIAGANLSTHFWLSGDVGKYPAFTETATNGAGNVSTVVRGASAITFTTGAMTSPVARMEKATREATQLSVALRKAGRMTCNGPNIINTDGSKFCHRGFVYGHGELATVDDPHEDVTLGANVVRFGVRVWGLYSGTTVDGQQIGAPGNLNINYLIYVVRMCVAIKQAGLKLHLFFDTNCGQNGNQTPDMTTYCTVVEGANSYPGQNFWTAHGQQQLAYFLQTVRWVLRTLYGLVDFIEPIVEPSAPGSNQIFAIAVINVIRAAAMAEDPDILIITGPYPGYSTKNIAAAYNKAAWKPDHNTILCSNELDNALTGTGADVPGDITTILAARNSLHVPVMVDQLGDQTLNDADDSILDAALTLFDTAAGGSIGYTIWEKVSAGPHAYGPYYPDGFGGRSVKPNRLAVISRHFKAAKTFP